MVSELFHAGLNDLGEGPLWLASSGELIWADILKGKVYSKNTITDEFRVLYHGNHPSCIYESYEDELIIADTNTVYILNRKDDSKRKLCSIDFDSEKIRFNDGKVDPNGNLWIGSMAKDCEYKKGSLYMITPDGEVMRQLENITISNGICWSLDKRMMYFIDTWEREVYSFDFDDKSRISNRKTVFRFPDQLGLPDGMSIDERGYLWIAMWGAASVLCVDPVSGSILEKIDVPGLNTTSCTFGGSNRDILFITSARDQMTPEELEKYPLSGSVFKVSMSVKGLPNNKFGAKRN